MDKKAHPVNKNNIITRYINCRRGQIPANVLKVLTVGLIVVITVFVLASVIGDVQTSTNALQTQIP